MSTKLLNYICSLWKVNLIQPNELPLWYEYKMFLLGVDEKKVKKSHCFLFS